MPAHNVRRRPRYIRAAPRRDMPNPGLETRVPMLRRSRTSSVRRPEDEPGASRRRAGARLLAGGCSSRCRRDRRSWRSSRAGVCGSWVDSLARRAKAKAVVAVIWRMASRRLRGRTRERPPKRVSLSPVPAAGGSSDATKRLDHPDLGLSRSTSHHSRARPGAHADLQRPIARPGANSRWDVAWSGLGLPGNRAAPPGGGMCSRQRRPR
jgi:hypothetical protein